MRHGELHAPALLPGRFASGVKRYPQSLRPDLGRISAESDEHGPQFGENLRGVTWVTINEADSGHWGIGGQTLTAEHVKALTAGRAAA